MKFSLTILISFLIGLSPILSANRTINKDSVIKHEDLSEMQPKHISDYSNMAKYYLDLHNDGDKFDSLSHIAISNAESSFNTDTILEASLRYLADMPLKNNFDYSNKIIKRVESLTDDLNDLKKHDVWLIISEAYLKTYEYQLAHKYSVKALSESLAEKNDNFYIRSLIAVGKSLESNQNFIEAFQSYMNAQYQIELLAEGKQKEKFKSECYESLFQFHNKVKNYDEAAKFKNLLIKQVVNNSPIDSTDLYWHYYDLVGLGLRSERFANIGNKLDEILAYAAKTGNQKMKAFSLGVYRSLLIESNNLAGFYDLYYNRYPEELAHIQIENPFLYNRILAYVKEGNNQIDSAKIYFEIAKTHIYKTNNPISKSNFHRRYGEFLLRSENIADALANYEKAFQFAKEREYVPYLITTSNQLDSINHQLKNYKNAYYYQKLHQQYQVEQSSKTKQDELLKIELNNESKQLKLVKQREKEATKKQHNLQYLIITIGISALFLLIIILSRVSIPEWTVRGLGFLGVLMFFEFIILLLDYEIHHLTHGAPLYIFIIKILILVILFPMHHIFEEKVVHYLISKKQIWKPNKQAIVKALKHLWPWVE